jgi:hypothetical protein
MRRKLEDSLAFAGLDPARADAFEGGVEALAHSSDVAADLKCLVASVAA